MVVSHLATNASCSDMRLDHLSYAYTVGCEKPRETSRRAKWVAS